MYRKILAAVDLSDPQFSATVVDQAERMAMGSSAELHVVTVAPTFNMPIVGSHFPEKFEETALEEIRKQLKAFLDDREDGGVPISGHVVHGTIYDEIMKAANKLECDLIVMAAHRPELKDYLLGPNASRVVRHARQSVFVVRPRETR